MQVNRFGLTLIGKDMKETDGGYVDAVHNTVFSVALENQHSRRCDVDLSIDGKEIGSFRINARSRIILERPVHDNGRFTAYAKNTEEYAAAGIPDVDLAFRGLITATFRLETFKSFDSILEVPQGILRDYSWPTDRSIRYSCSYNNSPIKSACCSMAMGTGLSGHSNQAFQHVAAMEYDETQTTMIHLRLRCKDVNKSGARPLTANKVVFFNNVPGPVE